MRRNALTQDRRWFGDTAVHLRWIIPLATALLGLGYLIIEEVILLERAPSPAAIARGALVLGVVMPVLIWLSLRWATKSARATLDARHQPTVLNQGAGVLHAVGEAVSRFLVEEKVLEVALRLLMELLEVPSGAVWLVDEGTLVLKEHCSRSEEFIRAEGSMEVGHCICGQSAATGETLIVNDLLADRPGAECACLREGFRSVAAVPMRGKGLVMGVMHFASPHRNAFSAGSQEMMAAVGDRIATAVENAWLYEEARRRAAYLEAASAIGRRITALRDLDTLLADVAAMIRGRFGYYQTRIYLVDEGGSRIVLKEANGPAAAEVKALGIGLRIGEEGITGRVAQTGQASLCNDVRQEPSYHPLELLPETRSELAMPMRWGKRIIGVIDVQSDRLGAFDQQDVTIMQVIGTQLAIAIENARLFRETTDRYEAMVALHSTTLEIISQLHVQQLLEALLSRSVQLLNAQASSLFLYDQEQGLIHNVANYNTWRDWTGVTVRPGEGVIGHVIQTGRPIIVNDYLNWECRADAFAVTPMTMVMGAPLKWQDQVLGGIIALREPPAGPFDEDDLWLLGLFADSATCAIKNAELHTEVRELSERLEKKVEERTSLLTVAKEELAAKARQLRSLLARTVGIQEEERRRIAHDMHDSVMQLIAAARFELQAARVSAGQDLGATAGSKLSAARELLGEAEQEIRRAIHNLTPSALDSMDIVHALSKHTADFQKLSGVSCNLRILGIPKPLPAAVEVACFRMVQEALHNVSKHAQASAASVILEYQPEILQVTVEDNGRGFDFEEWFRGCDSHHLGLLGMRERAESLGGDVQIDSTLGQGTCVVLRLPVRGHDGQGYGWSVVQSLPAKQASS